MRACQAVFTFTTRDLQRPRVADARPGSISYRVSIRDNNVTLVVSGFDYNTLVSVSGDVDFDHTRNNLQVYVPLTLLSTVSFLSYCLSFSLVDRGCSTGGDV